MGISCQIAWSWYGVVSRADQLKKKRVLLSKTRAHQVRTSEALAVRHGVQGPTEDVR